MTAPDRTPPIDSEHTTVIPRVVSDGLPAVLDGRGVHQVLVTGLRDPEFGAEAVDRWAQAAGVPVTIEFLGRR